MAKEEHIAQFNQGVDAWNAWRRQNPDVYPDLSGADLHAADLHEANLREAILIGADLREAILIGADLHAADLSRADLREAILIGADLITANLSRADLSRVDLSEALLNRADLSGANLHEANLRDTNLRDTNLSRADLSRADLSGASLVGVDLTDANLTNCMIYGISAWRLKLEGTKQESLVITEFDEPEITIDNIEVAQFIYLLLHNEKIRDVIDTITSKAVLILGRFTDERKTVLDALRDELRKPGRNYVPILFDFEKPRSQTTDETITLLARMVRFVIADVSDAKSVLQELRAIVPDLPSVPVQPLIITSQEEPGMFDFFNPRFRPSVLETYRYNDLIPSP